MIGMIHGSQRRSNVVVVVLLPNVRDDEMDRHTPNHGPTGGTGIVVQDQIDIFQRRGGHNTN